ncbi:CatB-related O-acetyltransferase [Confluentibacter sediminis]|uniref:CatB-related O-acetyltransferase n=1 Tax=Confluentibacter sediminis TaxID=2219045 RepID=UPI000DAE2FAC|nr:CatB-related O-acetyltransferase [Confluentibacter sediminis]
MKKLFRIFYLVPGLLIKLFEIANDGARDIQNKIRFKDAIIEKGASFNPKTILKENSKVSSGCILNNVFLESYSYIGRNCLIQNTSIGKFCSIANDVFIGLGCHPINRFSTSPIFYNKNNPLKIALVEDDKTFVEYKKIEIGNDVWIGARAIILDGVKIGNGAIIASGAIVTKDVEDYEIVGGIPAKLIKMRFEKDKINQLNKSHWWSLHLEDILSYFE